MGLMDRLRRRRHDRDGATLPDPAKPPENRGDWDSAAITNVDITEVVKREIHTVTRPWNR